MRTNIDRLIGMATNAGFKFSIPDAYAAADFIRKDKAATGVTLPAIDPEGNECGFTICLEEGAGWYSKYAEI
jgi:hypothetical protein